jgi:hypothetical protein
MQEDKEERNRTQGMHIYGSSSGPEQNTSYGKREAQKPSVPESFV